MNSKHPNHRNGKKSQKTTTRAWRSILAVEVNVKLHERQYHIAFRALRRLNASHSIIKQFPELQQEDLKLSRERTGWGKK